jgi:hypothetical protein
MTLLYLMIFLIVFAVVTVLTEVEWFGWSSLTLIGSIVAAHFVHVFDIYGYAKGHILNTLGYVGIYIVLGVLWSFAKWWLFLRNQRDAFRLIVKNAKSVNNIKSSFFIVPQASQNKSKIVAWMAYFPFSFVGTLLNDPIRKLFNSIFNQFKNLYQRMANSIFAEDIKKLEIDKKVFEEKLEFDKKKLLEEVAKIKL